MVHGEVGSTGATVLGRGAGRQQAEELAGSRQRSWRAAGSFGTSQSLTLVRAGSDLGAELVPERPVLPGRWLRTGRGATRAGRLLPPFFFFVGRQVCFAVFVVLPLTCFSYSSGKTYPSVRIGVTSPTACAALIKWLCSRGFDLFLKRAQRCLLPPSHQQAKLSPKALGSAAVARGGSRAQSLCSPGRAGGSSHGRGGRPRLLLSMARRCSSTTGAESRRGLPSLLCQREELSA